MEQGQAVAAEKILRRFVEAGDKGLDQVDDSYGYLGPLCQEAVALWGKAWALIKLREPNTLLKLVYEGVRNNDYAIRDHMIRDFAQALGTKGLLGLKEMFWAEYQANLTRKSMDDWDRRQPLRHLADVADALGDVDMYIDTQRRCDTEDVYALPIARRLLEADRADEALDYLNRADSSRSHFHGEPDDYITLKVKILQALGRNEDARNTLWWEFQRTLSAAVLDRLLSLTAKDQQQTLIDKAIAAAEAHADKLAAARFLLERGHPDRAAAIIEAHPEQFDERYYGHLLPLAEALQERFPASAWVLYRSLLLSILEQKRSKAYHHAADYLTMASELAEKAGMSEKHRALLAQLQSQHGRKSAFWRLVQKWCSGNLGQVVNLPR